MVLPKKPREVVQRWLATLNGDNSEALAAFYAKDTIYYQVNGARIEGREAIHAAFLHDFEGGKIIRTAINLVEDGEWIVLEWHDTQYGRGCSVFHMPYGRIAVQRDYGLASRMP